MFKGIILHWTAGAYTPNNTDLQHYHYLFDATGKLYVGKFSPRDNENCTDGKYAAHCGGGNTGRIGIAICCRRDANTVPTQKQVEAMCKKAAECCLTYGINPNNVMTHAKFGKDNPKTTSFGKIDIDSIPYAKVKGINECNEYLQGKVKWYFNKLKGDYLL